MREDIHEAFGRALECVRDQWAATPGVSAVIVYGSYLARKMGRYSDLDIMVIRSEDHPLRTVTAVECDMLVSLTIMGLGEFTRRLNAGCLSPLDRKSVV